MFYRARTTIAKITFSFISFIVDRHELFMLHWHGPDLDWAISDFDTWLKWQSKSDNMLDPYDVKAKLWECINDRVGRD